MQYLLQIFVSPDEPTPAPSEDEAKAIMAEYYAISSAPGVLGGAQLQPPETATTVRVEDGGR